MVKMKVPSKGEIYYKPEEKEGFIRVCKVVDDKVEIVDNNKENNKIISLDEINDYKMLIPDGKIVVNLIQMDELMSSNLTKDILMYYMYSKDDIIYPKVLCRQGILIGDVDGKVAIGDSLIRDNVSKEDFLQAMNCVSSDQQDFLSFYLMDLEDNLKWLFSLCDNPEGYNEVLREIKIQQESYCIGMQTTIEDLALNCNFIRDIAHIHGIHMSKYDWEGDEPSEDLYKEIFSIVPITHNIDDFRIFDFSKEINLKRIEKDYLIFKPRNAGLKIFVYEKNGEQFKS